MANIQNTFAFIFDSGKLGCMFYGEPIFRHMLEGGELSENPTEMVIYVGDIFINSRYVDIEPYVIKDEYCTLDFDDLLRNNQFKDYPFCWIIDNLSAEIAVTIDKRLKKETNAYAGLSRVDKTNRMDRKRYWESTIKSFSLHNHVITSFLDPQLEGEFAHSELAMQLGYSVEYKPLYNNELDEYENISVMHDNSGQQNKDVDRDLFTLNFSIRQELQISGALLWKSINALDKIYFIADPKSNVHLVEYPFFTLYFASQGIERIQKAIVELICKKKHIRENEKKSVFDLLTSHAHDRLNSWIEEKESIKFNSNCRKLIGILTRFYNTVRYARYTDASYLRSTTPEYDLLLELSSPKCSDLNDEIKNNFGKYLGQLAKKYYILFDQLCSELNIYAYELEYDSAACIVYYGSGDATKNLYKELKQRQNAKKEVLYWLIHNSEKYTKRKYCIPQVLEFDPELIDHYLHELIFNPEDGQEIYGEVDCLYDELCSSDKENWKERLELMEYICSEQ